MKTTIYLTLILILTTSFLSNKKTPSPIEDGLYYGVSSHFVKRHTIIKVEKSIAFIESYVHWQGEWVPVNSNSGKYFEPIKLSLDNLIYKKENITFVYNGKKHTVYMQKTFAGKFKMNVDKIKELDEKTNVIRNEALLFSFDTKRLKSQQDSIAYRSLQNEVQLNHNTFLQKFKSIVD